MWHLGIWFRGGYGGDELTVGQDVLEDLFQL